MFYHVTDYDNGRTGKGVENMVLELVGEMLKLTVLAGLALAGILVIVIWKKGLTNKVTFLRFFIQAVAVVVFFYIYVSLTWFSVLVIVIFAMTLVLGRFFCGWLCPFGLYMDLITLLRKAFKIRHRDLPEKLNNALNRLRYVILASILILPFVLGPIAPWQWPFSLVFAGPFKPLITLIGPIEPLIVPWTGGLEFFGLNISYPYFSEIVFYSAENFLLISLLIFFVVTFIGSFAIRRVWCRFCPTGASFAILNRVKRYKRDPTLHLDKDEEKCTKCGICKRVCPLQITDVYEEKGGKITTSMCMLCVRCVEMCPEMGCLKVKLAGKTVFQSRNWLEPSRSE
jgi:ferredoxin-type protein NapH